MVGPKGQGSVSNSWIHPMPCTAEWEIQSESQCYALSLRPHIPPYQMLIEETLVALETTSFGGDHVGSTGAVKLLS